MVSNPTDQGVGAANAIRDWIKPPADTAFDLDGLCTRLGISVQRAKGLDRRIDGLASAGPEHGPAILLNASTERRGRTTGDLERSLRFTWAHEVGHLLLDQGEWPAIVDALQQRVPRSVETRANAFATYLLLPEAIAYDALDNQQPHMSWQELKPALDKICKRFQVTRIVASRQVARGAPMERRRQIEPIFRYNISGYRP